jgi:HD superfamily phosphohydrolase YqeK
MLPEVRSIEAQLKQILYGCVEHVQATKAALYLSTSRDLNEKKYELVTHYQFNPADRSVIRGNDDLIDRLSVKRSPFYVNGLAADQRFAEILFRQGNYRILVAPLFSRGRLVGFIDMRDKAARKPFENGDVNAASKIADEMLGVLARNNLFGLAPLPLSDSPLVGAEISSAPALDFSLHSAAVAKPEAPPSQVLSPAATKVVEAARQHMARRQHSRDTSTRLLSEADLDPVRMILPAALAIPDAVLGAFSAIGHVNNPQIIVATGPVEQAALDRLQSHLEAWLKRTNQTRLMMRPSVTVPFNPTEPIRDLGPTFSAPVTVFSVEGLVLTISFSRQPEAAAQRALKMLLRQLEHTVDGIVTAASGKSERLLIAEHLLEPDFQKYPQIAEHSRQVASLAQKFARALELPAAQVETIRIAALVHDVGMRLLDYERLYRAASLTPEELKALAEHPVVGAALVEPLLGPEVSQAVLRHHERVDGKGYPSRLSGQQIPLAARILQIADVWVTMTSAEGYRTPISREEAAKQLRAGAGSQFDATLVERFLAALDDIAG